jgi:hypothetical protein
MKYTKTHVHSPLSPPKNILGWAGLDLNDLEIFFKNYPQILKKVDPKQFFQSI